uniref:Phospholipid hydroperoxide glutathione peroxidase, mitochondrial n=1 Tax=Nothoprocta perdicaria TaxID=30464 RepID=A0A8C6YLC7_NOTPE
MRWGHCLERALRCGVIAAARGGGAAPGGPAPRAPAPRARSLPQCAQADDWRAARSIYDFHAQDIDGAPVSLERYRGFVCIITNVASK